MFSQQGPDLCRKSVCAHARAHTPSRRRVHTCGRDGGVTSTLVTRYNPYYGRTCLLYRCGTRVGAAACARRLPPPPTAAQRDADLVAATADPWRPPHQPRACPTRKATQLVDDSAGTHAPKQAWQRASTRRAAGTSRDCVPPVPRSRQSAGPTAASDETRGQSGRPPRARCLHLAT